MLWRNLPSRVQLQSPRVSLGPMVCFLQIRLIIASSVFFANGQLGDIASIHNPSSSARHTPVLKEVQFRPASDHQSQQLSRHPSFSQPQPQATASRSAEGTGTPSYDMESWFSTFPASTVSTLQPTASSSAFTPFHVCALQSLFNGQNEVPELAPNFYNSVQAPPRQVVSSRRIY